MKRVSILCIVFAISLSYTHAQEEISGENEATQQAAPESSENAANYEDGQNSESATNSENVENVTNNESAASNDDGEVSDEEISYNLRRNEFFLESLRLKNLANLAITEGEYDESAKHSEEAMRYAKMSDEYIATMLVQQRANKAIAEAVARLHWAQSAQAEKYYPKEYEQASKHCEAAIDARNENNWEDALANALEVANDLNGVAEPPPPG